mmetsp:Transcript_2697/g.6746  ORF Transcript_2697/g.6746 Transcript_2697/m.6746 type:complete len:129 (-) Transcript_2697:295-681(-)
MLTNAGVYRASIRAASGHSRRRPAAADDGRYRNSLGDEESAVSSPPGMLRAGSRPSILRNSRSYETLQVSDEGSPECRSSYRSRAGTIGQAPEGFDSPTNVELILKIAERSQQTEMDVRRRTLQTCRL